MSESAFTLKSPNRNIDDKALLDDLLLCRDRAGTASLTMVQYMSLGKFSPSTYRKRFGSWNRSLELAGITIAKNYLIADEHLFENLARIWNESGAQPRYDDLRNRLVNTKYGAKTYANRFGSWQAALEAFVIWVNEGVVPDLTQRRTATQARTPRTINWRMRALVLMRDGARCQFCGVTTQDGARLHVDHIHPWSKGGETVVENLQILCDRCNIGKSDLVLESEQNP